MPRSWEDSFDKVLRRPKPVITQPTVMKTQYYTATSLDGFIATEDDSVDWLFPLGDPNETSYPSFIAEVGALAMGSTTYEWMLGHANEVAASTGSPWPYTQPTCVNGQNASPVHSTISW
jgi:dihydrofolate reductase